VSEQPLGLWFQGQQSCEPDESTKCRPSSLPRAILLDTPGLPLLSEFLEASRGTAGRGSTFLAIFFIFASLAFLPNLFVLDGDDDGERFLFGCGNLEDEVPARV
jgi:hypothetical protein